MSPHRIILAGAVWGCLALGGLAAWAEEVSVVDLLEKLKSSDAAVRLQAIDQLGGEGEKAADAVGPLADLLADESATVRAHAAWALGRIGPPAKPAVPMLVDLLKDSDQTVRRQAIKAVMEIRPGPRFVVPLVVRLLADSDPGVRMRILNRISEMGPVAVPGLIVALENDKAAYWACLVLREIGPEAKAAVPALTERLSDSRPEIRREAILALAAMDEAAAPAADKIAEALKDEHTCTAATYALARIGHIPEGAMSTIEANTQSDDKILRLASLWALARMRPDDKALQIKVREQLIESLKETDPFVRVEAARALAALPPAPEIAGPLWEKAFKDADEKTILHALDALASLGAPAVPRLVQALEEGKAPGAVAHVLGRIGPEAAPAVPALAKWVDNANHRAAHEAIMALANIGPGAKDAVPSLIDALKKEDNENAHAIIYALGRIGPDAAAAEPVLLELLKSPDRHLSLTSAWALANINPDSATVAKQTLPLLTEALADKHPLVRRGAAEALGSLGPAAKDAVPALRKALADENKSVQAAAMKALREIRGK